MGSVLWLCLHLNLIDIFDFTKTPGVKTLKDLLNLQGVGTLQASNKVSFSLTVLICFLAARASRFKAVVDNPLAKADALIFFFS